MIAMGAGTNHWFHSDQVYRTFLALVMLCGCEGVNGGGWAHYVGQEKVRPLAGWQTLAFALDWVRPTRHMSGTPFFYLATDQWRYERYRPSDLASPARTRPARRARIVDVNALGAALGWLPSYPSFDRSTLDLVDEADRRGPIRPSTWWRSCGGPAALRLRGPRRPGTITRRVMTVWRANLLGSSGKGHEYFLKHLLGHRERGAGRGVPAGAAPARGAWRDQAPEGKLDLLTTIDFRMTSHRAVLRRRAAGGHMV